MKSLQIIWVVVIFFINNIFASEILNAHEGKFFKISDNNIYVENYGNGPNVIFESGLGDGISSWEKIAPNIAQHAHVILYDRPGIGNSHYSSKTNKPRTAKDAVSDLLSLLDKIHAKPPYILVGHSLGGLYMQYFAQEYPEKTAGVVLVDSVSMVQKTDKKDLPPKNVIFYPEVMGIGESKDEVKTAKPFPNTKLIVLSAIHPANKSKAKKEEWANLQAELAKLSVNSQQITANNTDHYIHTEKPWLVVAAIDEIIKQSKITSKP